MAVSRYQLQLCDGLADWARLWNLMGELIDAVPDYHPDRARLSDELDRVGRDMLARVTVSINPNSATGAKD